MTDQATRVVPAGWYQDPATSMQVRWWNGVAWTEHVREKPDAAHAVTETTEQRIASARELERQFGIGTSEIPVVAAQTPAQTAIAAPHANPANAASPARTVSPANSAKRSAARASTAAAWMIALSPLLALVLGVVAAYVYFYVAAAPYVFLIAAAVPYLLCLLWALGDGRTLRDRGFTPPSAAFALLTGLGYLIVRRTRVPGSGPIAMLLVVTVLGFGSLPVAALLGQTQGLTNALNIQRTISADYLTHGKAVQVNCPPFVDAATVGTLYTCDATTATGVHRTIWVSIDNDSGKFSYSFGL